ncbi:hypothetical protein QJS10_CPA09g01239 [Acorus calamus]|uniref:Uncharacterized protein n=1 Tax=Acorus calamus TaxID=4465 RepID=A0AAV9E6Q7_ACOCL|nr:hypothetical protein QJS10_CPA09g01239 [Acorus calamus]
MKDPKLQKNALNGNSPDLEIISIVITVIKHVCPESNLLMSNWTIAAKTSVSIMCSFLSFLKGFGT